MLHVSYMAVCYLAPEKRLQNLDPARNNSLGQGALSVDSVTCLIPSDADLHIDI